MKFDYNSARKKRAARLGAKMRVTLITVAVLCMFAFLVLGLSACKDDPPPEKELKGYFFDGGAAGGGDGTKESPFNSLSDVSKITLKADENIYLKSGTGFTGSLALVGLKGTAESPVYVTSYGEGARPKIDGSDCQGSGVVYIENCADIVVENLEIYDSATDEGDRRGVLLDANNPSGNKEMITYSRVVLQNLYIHDIRGILDAENNGMSNESKRTGGIQIWTTDGYGKFEDLTITKCVIENVDNVGIASNKRAGECDPYSNEFKNYAFKNVKITHNEIFNIGKNAMFIRNVYEGLVEYNVVHDTCLRCFTGNQIVTRSVDTILVQYNEGYNNMAIKSPISSAGIMDGCMLDADLLSRNTIWQYNYSHDNSFGLFLNCTGSSSSDSSAKDTAIVRYNLSVNDRGNKGIVYINYYSAGIEVYNNTFITSKDDKPIIFQANNDKAFNFFNNVIYNRSSAASISLGNMSKGALSNNLIFNAQGAAIANLGAVQSINANGLYADPMLLLGVGETLKARTGDPARDVCHLFADSPVFGAGKEIDDKPKDMFGNNYRNVVGCAFD